MRRVRLETRKVVLTQATTVHEVTQTPKQVTVSEPIRQVVLVMVVGVFNGVAG